MVVREGRREAEQTSGCVPGQPLSSLSSQVGFSPKVSLTFTNESHAPPLGSHCLNCKHLWAFLSTLPALDLELTKVRDTLLFTSETPAGTRRKTVCV